MLLVLAQAWIREYSKVQHEKDIRRRMLSLISKKFDVEEYFTSKDVKHFNRLSHEVNADTMVLREDVHDLVEKEMTDAE